MTTKRSALPFSNPVGDSLELMKRMWGFAGLPGIPGLPNAGHLATMAARIPQQLPNMLAPTFDINELEKRIADLRAVEQWLELNASILRTTIQSLEVQRATIATLKGISGAMLAPMAKSGAGAPPPEVQLGLAAMKSEEAAAETKSTQRPAEGKQPVVPAAGISTAPFNPAAWWNTLQDQFVKIASTTAGAASSPQPASKRARKNAAKRKKPRKSSA